GSLGLTVADFRPDKSIFMFKPWWGRAGVAFLTTWHIWHYSLRHHHELFRRFQNRSEAAGWFRLRPALKRRAFWPALQAKQIDAGVGHRGCFREKVPICP